MGITVRASIDEHNIPENKPVPATLVTALSWLIDSVKSSADIKQAIISTDQTVSWPASSVVNTQMNIDLVKPSVPVEVYQLEFMNSSRVTDLEVEVKALETSFASETREVPLCFPCPVPKASSAVLCDCESAWTPAAAQGAHVVCTADAVTYLVGTHSAKMAMDVDAAVGLLATVVITSANLSPYTHLQLWMRSTINLNAGDLLFLADNTALCASPYESLGTPALTANTWTLCTLKLATPASDLACICLGISQAVDKGAFDLYIDDVVAFKPGYYAPLLTGLFNGCDLRLSPRNLTALGANDAFSMNVRVKEYK